MEDNIKMNLK